jgi:hypothetical protein
MQKLSRGLALAVRRSNRIQFCKAGNMNLPHNANSSLRLPSKINHLCSSKTISMSESLTLFPSSELTIDYQKLYLEVCRQVEKDFHPHCEISELPEVLNPEWISAEVSRLLRDIIESKPSVLGPILYRIDLSEKLVRTAMNTAKQHEKLPELTAMVVKREAQKVWLRHTLK